MKKKTLLLAALFAVSGLVSAQTAPKNLIRNPQFLNLKSKTAGVPDGRLPDPWYVTGGIKALPDGCGVSTTEKPEGYNGNTYVVKGSVLLTQSTLAVTPGKTYRISCMMKTTNMPWKAQARLQVIWLDKGWRELMKEWVDSRGQKQKGWDHQWVWTGGNTDWKKYEIPAFTAPPNAKYAKIRIGFGSKEAGVAYYADLKMEECAATDPFLNRVTAIPFGKSFNDAAVIDGFTVPGAFTASQHPTTVKVYFDNEALHIQANCHQVSVGGEQFMDSVKKNVQDNLELLFLPPGAKKQFHFLAAPSGWTLGLIEEWSDKKWPFDRWNWDVSKFNTKVEVKENDWIVTTHIPFAAMGRKSAPKDGEVWRVSFCRNVQTRGQELSAWAKLDSPYFQRTDSFGKGIFRRKGIVANSPKLTVEGISVTVRNLSGKPETVTINRIVQDEKSGHVVASQQITIPANGKKDIRFDSKGDPKKMLWTELYSNSKLIAKHHALSTGTHFALEFLDPEKVRTQTVYLATDMPFFISWLMKHNLPTKHREGRVPRSQIAVDVIMEIPDNGLNFRGVMHDMSAYREKQSPLIPPKVKNILIDGKKYKQFRFEMPLISNKGAPQFLFFYDCNMAPGKEFTGKMWFEMDGKVYGETEKLFKTIKVGKVKKPFQRLPFNIGLMDAVTLYNWFPKDALSRYYDLGFNCLSIPVTPMISKEFYKGTNPKTHEDYYDLMYQDFLKDPRPFFMNTVSITTGPEEHVWTRRGEPNTVGIKRDGTKCTSGGYAGAPGLCFNYRGPLHKKWLERLKNSSAFAKYRITWLSLDMETWRPPSWDEICYCETCLKAWVVYCNKKGRPDLAKVDPRTATGDEFKKFWKQFQIDSAAGFSGAAIQVVKEAVKGARPTSPWGAFTSQDYSDFKHITNDENDLGFFENSVYFTPDGNYEKLKRITREHGSARLATGLSYGQTGGCPDWFMTPEHAKESIFEVMIFGTRQVVYYYNLFMEPLRMSKIVDALNAVTPFEDIIIEGKLADDVTASTKDLLLTHRNLGNESLLAVRSYYAEKDVTGKITFSKIPAPLNVYDAETGEIVGKVSPQNPSFTYKIAKKRCRLLYLGTTEQWKKRHN